MVVCCCGMFVVVVVATMLVVFSQVLPLIQDGLLLKRLTSEHLLCADVGASGAASWVLMRSRIFMAHKSDKELKSPQLWFYSMLLVCLKLVVEKV